MYILATYKYLTVLVKTNLKISKSDENDRGLYHIQANRFSLILTYAGQKITNASIFHIQNSESRDSTKVISWSFRKVFVDNADPNLPPSDTSHQYLPRII